MTNNVVPLSPKPQRPADAIASEVLEYTSTTAIGFDVLPDGAAQVFRCVNGVMGFMPVPDAGTACTILLLLHHEVMNSRAGDLTWREGFNAEYVAEELADITAHYAPVSKLLADHGMKPFDEAFDVVDHLERVQDGREPTADQI